MIKNKQEEFRWTLFLWLVRVIHQTKTSNCGYRSFQARFYKHGVLAFFLLVALSGKAALGLSQAFITMDTLPQKPSIREFLRHIETYHPQSLQAGLLPVRASAEQMKAKGNFDPVLEGRSSQKYFDNKQYFSLSGGELKIPTWIGADIKAGYEQNGGAFLGPENSTPQSGLLFGGISMPLGRGLFFDERRLSVREAALKIQSAQAKKQIGLNEILFEAAVAYWEWFRAYHALETWRAAAENAKIRYQATLLNASSGDRPALDTLEARVQMQNLMLGQMQADAEWQKLSLQLSSFIWNKDLTSYGFEKIVLPPDLNTTGLGGSPDWAEPDQNRFTHPYLDQLLLESQAISLQKKWAVERRKPAVQLQYIPLAEAMGNEVWNQFSLNNYKWGLEVKFPLLFRKERADIQLVKLRAQENTFEYADKKARLHSKVIAQFTIWKNYREQNEMLNIVTNQYRQLYEAEMRLFNLGESSLFMVNQRELAYLQARLKWVDVAAKFNLTWCELYYYGGRMGLLTRME